MFSRQNFVRLLLVHLGLVCVGGQYEGRASGRSAGTQALFQLAALGSTLGASGGYS
jgi:hypothetical protein